MIDNNERKFQNKTNKKNNNSKGTDTDYKVHTILVQTERKKKFFAKTK